MNFFRRRGQRGAGGVISNGLPGDKGGGQMVQQLQLPRVTAGGLIIPVGSIGVQLPDGLFGLHLRGFQRKRGAVGRTNSADYIKMERSIQLFQLPAGIHHPARGVQHQLAECRRHRRRVAAKPRQSHRNGRTATAAVFQRGVHQALVRKGKAVHGAAGQLWLGMQAVP